MYTRADVWTKLELLERTDPMGVTLVLREPKNARLRVEKDCSDAIQRWQGEPSQDRLCAVLAPAFKLRYAVSALLIFWSIPRTGDPERGFPGNEFRPVELALGLLLLAIWLVARLRPTRYVFLAEIVWMLLLIIGTVLMMALERHFGGVIVVGFLVFAIHRQWKWHVRFARGWR